MRQGSASLSGTSRSRLSALRKLTNASTSSVAMRARGCNGANDVLVDGAVSIAIDGDRTRNRANVILPQKLKAPEFGAEAIALVAWIAAIDFHDDAASITAVELHAKHAAIASRANALRRRHDNAPERGAADRLKIRPSDRRSSHERLANSASRSRGRSTLIRRPARRGSFRHGLETTARGSTSSRSSMKCEQPVVSMRAILSERVDSK